MLESFISLNAWFIPASWLSNCYASGAPGLKGESIALSITFIGFILGFS